MAENYVSFRVDALASEAGLSVDTVRYYQKIGILEPPERIGRHSEYSSKHLDRLTEIRRLADAGLTLSQISELSEGRGEELHPLVNSVPALSRSDVAKQAGVPEGLVTLLCDNGLLQPVVVKGSPRFNESAVAMVRAGLAISNAGVPLEELVALASEHAENIDDITDKAIELFDDHIRGLNDSQEDLVDVVHTLLPAVTRLVAQHFYRTLVTRALEKAEDGEYHSLAETLRPSITEDLVVTCTWH